MKCSKCSILPVRVTVVIAGCPALRIYGSLAHHPFSKELYDSLSGHRSGEQGETFLFLSDVIKYFFSILNKWAQGADSREGTLTLRYPVCARHHANNFITVRNDESNNNHRHSVLILGQHCALSHLILSTTLSSRSYDYPHFTDENTEVGLINQQVQ